MAPTPFFTREEEIANALSHGLGIVLGIAGGYFLYMTALGSGNIWAVASVGVYIFGMLSSYIASTWYHACTHLQRKEWLRKIDHSAIYLHIAGTYVPFTLVVLRESGAWGWSVFALVWLATSGGLYMSFTHLKRHSHLETICFVLLGCSILIAIKPFLYILNSNGQLNSFYWLVAGGMAYITGAIC